MSNIRVTQAQIDALIENAEITVETIYEKVTVVTVKLENGFCLSEASGAVDPANYSEAIGKDICLERIKNRLWELEGYALQKEVYERAHPTGEYVREKVGTFGWALNCLRSGFRMRRRGWNGKNQYIVLASNISYTMGGVVVNCNHDAIGNKAIAFVGTSGIQMGWLASQADMLAEDWELARD